MNNFKDKIALITGGNSDILSRVPLAKMGAAQDVAKMVAYFCSDAASFITGAEVVMDGGMSL